MEFQYLLRIRRKRWKQIVGIVLLSISAAGVLTSTTPRSYQSTSKLYISTSSAEGQLGTLIASNNYSHDRVKTYQQLVQTPGVLDPVAKTLGYKVWGSQVDAKSPNGTVLINITAHAPTGKGAADIANAVGQQLARVIETIESPLGQGTVSPVKVSVVQVAPVPGGPSSPRPRFNYLMGGLLGFVLGAGLILVWEALDNTVRRLEDVLEITGVNPVGIIGFDPNAKDKPLSALNLRSSRSESFKAIRTNLQFVDVDKQPKVIVISSALPSEGKTTTVINLAITFAQAGQKVCLVEADLRKPRVAQYLGIDGSVGLTNVLAGQVPLSEALVPWNRGMLQVLPSGPVPPNPSELLASEQMGHLLEYLRNDFDYVFIDGAPLLPVTDAAVVARVTDGVLMMVRFGKTTHEQLHRATETLSAVGARLLGPVINFVPSGSEGYGYGYGYGYSYGYSYGYGYGRGYGDPESKRSQWIDPGMVQYSYDSDPVDLIEAAPQGETPESEASETDKG